MKKTLARILVLVMVLGVCAFGASAETTPVTDWVTYQTTSNEMETWNILHSQGARDLDVLTNCIDGLLSNDEYGKLIPNAAESWSTADGGKTWIFNLRQGNTWVNQAGEFMANVVAEDWLWGLEWVLNFWKNEAANASMPMEMIAGATDYYTYTKGTTADSSEDEIAAFNAVCEKYDLPAVSLTTEEAKALDLTIFKQIVGIEAVDEYTLKYTCSDCFPYFDTLTTYNCLYPVSGALLAELGVDAYVAVEPSTLWYNGPYIVTTYVQNNEKVFTPNPAWWDTESTRFDSVTVKMVESLDIAYQLYQTGELNYVQLSESNLQTIYRASSHEFNEFLCEARPTKYSYQIHLVYDKNLEDGTPDEAWNKAVANEAFRLSWYYGLDLTNFLSRTNAINPLTCTNYCYTMINVAKLSDGRDYTDLVLDNLGLAYSDESFTRYDAEKAAAYKAQAMEELTALGVTFPINVDYYVMGSNQTQVDTGAVLKQMFSDYLGDDYVTFNVKTYVTSINQEVRNPQLASFFINGWGADYGDPQNYLGQETYDAPNAYYSNSYSKINLATDETLIATYEEFTRLVNEAMAITDDLDARYAAYAEAEAYFIEHALTIPAYINITWELTCVNDFSKIYAAYGIQNNRYINWETNFYGYTTEEYAACKAAYEANK